MISPREEQRDAPPLARGHNPAGEYPRPFLRVRRFFLSRPPRTRPFTVNSHQRQDLHDGVVVAYRYSPAEVFKGAPGPSINCHDRRETDNKEERKPNAVLLSWRR